MVSTKWTSNSVVDGFIYTIVEVLNFWHTRLFDWWFRKPTKEALLETLRTATQYEVWESAALELDELTGNDLWRQNPTSKYYDYRLIYSRLRALIAAREEEDILSLVNLLRSGLVRNLGNISTPRLFTRAFAGTKLLIEDYVTQVALAIEYVANFPTANGWHGGLTSQAKLDILHDTRQAFGRSALVLQGGAIFGLCHIGVVKALHLRGLLPRIICGTATGALIAALVGVHDEEELLDFLNSERIDLSAFASQPRGKSRDGERKREVRAGSTLWQRVKRYIRQGYFLDIKVLEDCVRANVGDLTFEEAYQRTKRVLNITVPVTNGTAIPSLLNYLTAPNVLIWSAAAASNAMSGPLYASVTLLCKDEHGNISPWRDATISTTPSTPMSHSVLQLQQSLPSGTSDLHSSPFHRITELFNVNHFVVSQARPYIVPFLQAGDTLSHTENRERHMTSLRAYVGWFYLPLIRSLVLEVRHRLRQLDYFGFLPASTRRFLLDEDIPGASLTLVPELNFNDFSRLFDRPTKATLDQWILRGERSVWPAVGALKVRCAAEVELDRAYQVVRRRKPMDGLSAVNSAKHLPVEGANGSNEQQLKGTGEKRKRLRSRTHDGSPTIPMSTATMVLSPQRPSAFNEMLGRNQSQLHATNKSKTSPERPSKRVRLSPPPHSSPKGKPSVSPSKRDSAPVPDSDEEEGYEEYAPEEDEHSLKTDLEAALPPIKTDKQAIEEYELERAAEAAEAEQTDDASTRLGKRKWVRGRSSIYVDAFILALDTVLEDESHLFDASEMQVFDDFKELSYEAQFLYVRLFLRKTSAWHRMSRLGYYSDIANMDAAVEELLERRSLPEQTSAVQSNPGELEPPEGTVLQDEFTFADCSDKHITTLEEASSLLLLDELKVIAKDAKVQGKNKGELLKALRRTSGKQTALDFAGLKRSDTEESAASPGPGTSREPSPTKQDNRDAHYTAKILKETGRCVRLTAAPLRLFERVHLVFYRSTEWNEKSLLTIILSKISRWTFPDYIVSRSANVFPSRSMLLEYEASLRTQFFIDSIIDFTGSPPQGTLQDVLNVFEEVYPRWKVLLKEEQEKEKSIYADGEGAYLRRLSPAWVYTRIVHKAAAILGQGKFKDHEREHQLMSELLDQRLFHHSRRGAWYQRKALVEQHYLHETRPSEGRLPEEQKKFWKRIALQTCEQGLQDNLVHIIYHYDLQKRLVKLEKALNIPKRLQHDFGHTSLTKPEERTFEGIQIERPVSNKSSNSAATTQQPASLVRTASVDNSANRRGAKTVWIDPLEDGECSVEAMCLSHYRTLGFKGFHSEGGIVRTLFACLCFDVLFTYVPNVFQTQYQTCPLDLHTDEFFVTRMSEMNARLAEIANGAAESIIRRVWAEHSEKRTCVVGLDWNFELEDLVEISRCFPGDRLSTLIKMVGQEYAERGSGVPDLFLWRYDEDDPSKRQVMFSEVKSENDRLSDKQRMWIHVMSGTGIRVELCHAVAKEVRVAD